MGVAHGVGKRLAQYRRKAVGDVGGCMLGQNLKLNLRTAVRACAFNDAFELHGEVGRIVVERVDAGAHELKRLVNGVFDVSEIGGDAGLVGVDHAQSFGLKRSARELVAHVIVDLARDAGAFGERRELDFVVLAVGEVAVACLECQGAFCSLSRVRRMRSCSRSSCAVRSDSNVAATERMAVSSSVRVVSAPPRRSATSAQTNTALIAGAGQMRSRRTRRAMS